MQTSEIKPIVTRQELLNTFELMPTVSTGTWATSPERTAKRALNTRRVNGYIIISISCSNTLVSARGRGINLWEVDFRLRDFDAILFAFRCDNEDCRCKIRCFIIIIIINNLGVIQVENGSFLGRCAPEILILSWGFQRCLRFRKCLSYLGKNGR